MRKRSLEIRAFSESKFKRKKLSQRVFLRRQRDSGHHLLLILRTQNQVF